MAATEWTYREIVSDGVSDEYAYSVLLLTDTGVVSAASPSAAFVLGASPQDLLGRSLHELVHPEDIEAISRLLCDLLRQPLRCASLEFRYRHPTGPWVLLRGTATNLLRGSEVSAILCQIAPVSDKPRSEASERIAAGQLTAISEALAIILQTGNWKEASEVLLAKALSQTGADLGVTAVLTGEVGAHTHIHTAFRPVQDPGSTESAPIHGGRANAAREIASLEQLAQRVLTSEKPLLEQSWNSPREGAARPKDPKAGQFFGVPVRRGNQVLGMLGVARHRSAFTPEERSSLAAFAGLAAVLFDCFQRTRQQLALEEQSRQTQKMEALGRLAGGIAHDFNNLIAVVSGYSELLQERAELDGSIRAAVNGIQDAAQKASLLTRQLLTFSRKTPAAVETLDLNEVLSDIKSMLHRLIGEDVDLVVQLDPTLDPIQADPSQLQQVILNLAVNARDAMPSGGKLTLTSQRVRLERRLARRQSDLKSGDYALLTISDTGCGMSEETQARIFEPFFTTKPSGVGTGLGLATVYSILQRSGAHIQVESALGQGTTFRIYFPVARAAVTTAAPARPEKQCGTGTILLVEDEEMVRQMIRQMLEGRGYSVIEAAHADEALRLDPQRIASVDLLLTDVVMPGGLSGRDLAERLCSVRPDLKVLYMSGYTSEAISLHGIATADSAFIQKPFTWQKLSERISTILKVA